MFRALFWKELRGGWPWAIPSALLMAWIAVSVLVDFKNPLLREVDLFSRFWDKRPLCDEFVRATVAFCSIALGLFLGLWQTVPESVSGTAAFFAHVARRPARILTAKIASTLVLFGVAVVIPLAALVAMGTSADGVDYMGIIVAGGVVVYLATAAAGVRGLPWREGLRQLAGLSVIFVAVGYALNEDSAAWLLAPAAAASALWAFSGAAIREHA